MQPLAYLTAGIAGVGGRIKDRPEDFFVSELPAYEPSGEGTHVYFGIRKRGVPTRAAAERIARRLGVDLAAVGYAGLKDAQAVTEQTMSVEHIDPARLEGFDDGAVRVLWVSRHTNKLKKGHLSANRFVVRIRGVGPGELPAATEAFDVLARRGVPNYYGAQRFGSRGLNWRLGAAAVRGDLDEFARVLLGEPRDSDPPEVREACELYAAGQLAEAMRRWPGGFRAEKRALGAVLRTGRARSAFAAMDKFSKRFMISAYQSYLFNRVLEQRLQQLDTVVAGDLAQRVDSGGVFLVEDELVEAARAQQFEISPTGPLFGYRAPLAEGAPGKIEQQVLADAKLTTDDWRRPGAHKIKGARRALRFAMGEPGISASSDNDGPYIELRFSAPAGCYATTVLREIMKADVPAGEEP